MKKLNARIWCADQTSLSVQAGQYLYSQPRDDAGPYTHVEVGFVENGRGEAVIPPESWLQYADTGELRSDVYGYVPIELVVEFVGLHGGITSGALP